LNRLRDKALLRTLLRTFSILVGAAALLCGVRALRREVYLFDGPPRTAFLPEFRAQLRTVTERLPPGEHVLHLSATPEYWYSRLWQRALYPRNEAIVMRPPISSERLREIRARYGARFAISAGDPPADPGYLWKVDLGPVPLIRGTSWFGELQP
jgi:hypothetical protein